MTEVLSDPSSQLPRKTAKYRQSCKELHLAGKKITTLAGFEDFLNLESLWINNNNIRELVGLENNFRLKFLYCHENKIRTITDCLAGFTFLNTLTLNNNLLDDINEVINELKFLRHLKHLDLHNNPVAEEDNYRLRIIAVIPWIEVLDSHIITKEERINAKLFKKREKMGLKLMTKKRQSRSELLQENERNRKISEILEKIKLHLITTRCFLEQYFFDYDPRKLGLIEEEEFWKVLGILGVHQLLSGTEQELLLSKYKRLFLIDAINPSGTLPKQLISYQAFCSDTLPKDLRVTPDQWKLETNPIVSATATDLHLFVKTLKNRRRIEEFEATRTSIMSASMSAPALTGNATSFTATGGSYNSNGGGNGSMSKKKYYDTSALSGLEPWDVAELSKIIRKCMKLKGSGGIHHPGGTITTSATNTTTTTVSTGNNTDELTKDQVDRVFYEMKLLGKVPSIDMSVLESRLFPSNQPTISLPLLCTVLGCDLPKKQMEIKKTKEPQPPSLINLQGQSTSKDISKTKCIRWRNLTPDEVKETEFQITSKAQETMEMALRANKVEEMAPLTQSAMQAATAATRLSTMRIREVPVVGHANPYQVMSTAPNRADILVLPGLCKPSGGMNRGSTSTSTGTTSNGSQAADWSKTMSSLGLKGEELQDAIERKQRSKTAMAARRLTEEVSGRYETVKYKKGVWSLSTGTLVL